MRAKQWTHGKMMLMVPFAITHAVAHNKGGTHDYGWGDLQFTKDYKEKNKGNPPGIMCDIFFLVPGCVSGLFMNNMESFLYDGHKVPGTPMTQMCAKEECPAWRLPAVRAQGTQVLTTTTTIRYIVK